ncbi:MAG: hypothetical protein WD708_05790 [Kiritimatiellia bacterium]
MFEPITFTPFTDHFYETGAQMQEWVLSRAREHFQQDRKRRESICGQASFNDYVRERRERFLASLGGLPDAGGYPTVHETGDLQRSGYRIRKLVYESLPSFYVPALLYVPDELDAPAPAVFMGCGHGKDGKAAPKYQQVCIDLVRSGFVVLIIDSPSHGEMVQCLDPATKEPLVGLNCPEHSYLQISASIPGQNIARYFLWNALKGIDLLAGLPEVDADRIGMTGNSGGGTLTQYVMMTDSRIKVAVPCCSLSSHDSYFATGCRALDGEQNLFASVPDGVDYADFLSVFAPRPLRVGAAEYDYFCIEDVVDTVEQARIVYRALGAEDALDLCIAEKASHGYSTALRQGAVEWFTRHLQGRSVEPFEDEPEVETAEALRCTESGQVLLEFVGARSILDLNRDEWNRQRAAGKTLSRSELIKRMDVQPVHPLHPRLTARIQTGYGRAERVFFFSEPGIITAGVVYAPASRPERAVLLVIPDGTEGQDPYADFIRERLEAGQLVMVFDVRGTGAVKMHTRNGGKRLEFRSTEYRVAGDHFMLGTSLAARRAHDVLQTLRYLRGREDIGTGTPIELTAYGRPAIYALLAAAVDENLAACTFEGLPGSWAEAFEEKTPQPERISESLILPELAGIDIHDLVLLAKAGKKVR